MVVVAVVVVVAKYPYSPLPVKTLNDVVSLSISRFRKKYCMCNSNDRAAGAFLGPIPRARGRARGLDQ